MKNFQVVRFYLFANSHSANRIATYLKTSYKGKKIVSITKNLSTVLRFKQKHIVDFVLYDVKPKCPYQRIPKSIKTYLEIEKELIKLTEEKSDKYSTALEDYRDQLLYPAVERAIGNFLTDVKNDNCFQSLLEKNIRSAHYTYYKVACKYRLPTIRIVPFMTRLIT